MTHNSFDHILLPALVGILMGLVGGTTLLLLSRAIDALFSSHSGHPSDAPCSVHRSHRRLPRRISLLKHRVRIHGVCRRDAAG